LHPLELAERLDPDGATLERGSPAARAPIQALRAQRQWFRAARRGPGDAIGADLLSGESLETLRVEARRLVTPAGQEVAFVRLGSFRWNLEDALAEVAELFRHDRHWIIDLTGNPGGAWAEAGLLMSYFLPPGTEFVPHEVRSSRDRGALFSTSRIRETHRLRRTPVEQLRPETIHVLVDQDTASAAEIVAAFLRAAHGAALVGERTAGAEFSTGDFLAPDGSVLSIGLGGGMIPPIPHFQGRGLEVDIEVRGAADDLEAWRASFALLARSAALAAIDEREPLE
ncbi:MAG: S41 family peptidase, partial [Planctomycetota bacterium]|nr:S41 family peptidase [Planctomycetota bacterium]